MPDVLSRCEPPPQYRELPYHWVQWRTPYRSEDPQPWGWLTIAKMWRPVTVENSSALYTPERAALLQYHYLEPAFPPLRVSDEYKQVTIEVARVLALQYYAARFSKSTDDPLVLCAANDRWETVGLTQAQALLDTLGRMGFSIRRW